MFTQAAKLPQLKSMQALLCLQKGDVVWWNSDDYPTRIKTTRKENHVLWTPIRNLDTPRATPSSRAETKYTRENWLVFTVEEAQSHRMTLPMDGESPDAIACESTHEERECLLMTMQRKMELKMSLFTCLRLHWRAFLLHRTVRVLPGRLSALSVFHSKSGFFGAFVWARRTLNSHTVVSGPGSTRKRQAAPSTTEYCDSLV